MPRFLSCISNTSNDSMITTKTETANMDIRTCFVSHEAATRGKIKISLQYFSESQQLRAIFIRASKLTVNSCHVETKISLTGGNFPSTRYLPNKRVKGNEVHYKDEMYFDIDSEDLLDTTLQIQMYKITTIFKRKRINGQAVLQLENLNLDMDTTMWVNLVTPETADAWKPVDHDDILICTEDRSILAETTASIYGSENGDYRIPSAPTLLRTRSLPASQNHFRPEG